MEYYDDMKNKKTGRIDIVLEEFRIEHGISKNKIAKNADLQMTQLNTYLNNQLSRVELGVLARICDYLHCEISDVLRYVPYEEQEQEKENHADGKE